MDLPNRKSPRLHGYDYSNQNYYFITICTHEKMHLFGDVNALNGCGKTAETELLKIPEHCDGVQIDKCIIMPNHVHAIVIIGCVVGNVRNVNVGNGLDRSALSHSETRPFPTLSSIIGLYKSGVTKCIHAINPKTEIWQKSFYDRIIRNEKGYLEVWQYIDENPIKWEQDCFYSNENFHTTL